MAEEETCWVPRKRPTHQSTQLWAHGRAMPGGVAQLLQQATSPGDHRASFDRSRLCFLGIPADLPVPSHSLSGPCKTAPPSVKVEMPCSLPGYCHRRERGLGANFLAKAVTSAGATRNIKPGFGAGWVSQPCRRPPPSPRPPPQFLPEEDKTGVAV